MTNGLVNTERLQIALGSATDNGVGGVTDTAPCVINGAQAPGCVPFSIFGGYSQATGQGSITPDMAKYVQYEAHDIIEETMRDYTANISGDLFDMPAGPFGLALGVESLEHDALAVHPDALSERATPAAVRPRPLAAAEGTQGGIRRVQHPAGD